MGWRPGEWETVPEHHSPLRTCPPEGWAAIVLAGGQASRLGGVDKPGLAAGGRTILDGVLAACHGATPIVVVGPRRATALGDVQWVREDPPHTGPLAALATGLAAVPPETALTAVVAADMPNVGPHTLRRLRAALTGPGTGLGTGTGGDQGAGAVLVDESGQPQWLCGVWRTAALGAALAGAGDLAGRPARAVLSELDPIRVPAEPGEAFDVDTPDDLRVMRQD